MKFFVDTADIQSIKELTNIGIIDGVTTNPSLIYKSGKDFKSRLHVACRKAANKIRKKTDIWII